MKKTKSIFALTLCSVLALGTSAHADYVLRLKPRFGCPAGQILYLGACILEANIPNQNNQGGNQGGNEGPGDNPGGNQGENPSTDPTTTCEVENCASCVTDQSNACDTCDDGYHTQNGACVEDCTSNSCGTHETCNNSTHECECATGYTGDNCASCDENYHMKNNACVANCTTCASGYTCSESTHECEENTAPEFYLGTTTNYGRDVIWMSEEERCPQGGHLATIDDLAVLGCTAVEYSTCTAWPDDLGEGWTATRIEDSPNFYYATSDGFLMGYDPNDHHTNRPCICVK